jgi:hydrogenase/urease accessory protein HupE
VSRVRVVGRGRGRVAGRGLFTSFTSFTSFALLACVALLFASTPAAAHELRAASLALLEVAPGRFQARWVPPTSASDVENWAQNPVYPSHCHERGGLVDCGERGLSGNLDFPALRAGASSVAVRVSWYGGRERNYLVTSANAPLRLNGALPNGGERLRVAFAYLRLGVEHILTGFDHVLFVIGLMLLVRFGKQLLVTVTAFTVAHTLTLASAVLGFVTLPERPVEAVIALSILLVALECGTPGTPTLSRRFPWLVAFGFGLLHGFGFAGALSAIGLPEHQVPLALACFNFGVELGQLSLVLVAWLLLRLIRLRYPTDRSMALVRLERGFVYAMGSLSAYWVLDRVLATFG